MSSEKPGRSLPWFRVDVDLVDHPKLFELSTALGTTDGEALAFVIRLWAWAMRYAARGRLAPGARLSVERACGWRGTSGALWAALLSTGWVDDLGAENYEVHDWAEHNGAAVAKAEKDAERKRQQRTARGRLAPGARLSMDAGADRRAAGAGDGTGRDGTKHTGSSAVAPELALAPVESEQVKKVDPRLTPLRDRLVATFLQVRGCKYLYGGVEDTQALKRLMSLADDDEIDRRWRAALAAGDAWPGTSSLAQLASSKRWNSLAAAPVQRVSIEHQPSRML